MGPLLQVPVSIGPSNFHSFKIVLARAAAQSLVAAAGLGGEQLEVHMESSEFANQLVFLGTLQIAPMDEEISAMRAFDGTFEDLAPPEKVLALLASIPRLRQKLQALLFQRQCGGLVADATSALRCAQDACTQVSFHPDRYVLTLSGRDNGCCTETAQSHSGHMWRRHTWNVQNATNHHCRSSYSQNATAARLLIACMHAGSGQRQAAAGAARSPGSRQRAQCGHLPCRRPGLQHLDAAEAGQPQGGSPPFSNQAEQTD